MSIFLQLAFLLSVILLSAKMAGYLSIRLGQPSVLGELLVGILLGPSIINILNLPFIEHELTETIVKLGELGVKIGLSKPPAAPALPWNPHLQFGEGGRGDPRI